MGWEFVELFDCPSNGRGNLRGLELFNCPSNGRGNLRGLVEVCDCQMAKSTLFLSIKARYLQTYLTFQGNGLLKTSLVKSVDFGYLINLKFCKPFLLLLLC